jgi:hypothetical protein
MAKARGKSRPKPKPAAEDGPVPVAKVVPHRREIEARLRRRGQVEVGAGAALMIGGVAAAITVDGSALTIGWILLVFALWLLGVIAIAAGASRLDTRAGAPATADKRRWIYGGLAALFAVVYLGCMWKVIPNRLPSAFLHLATVPMFTFVMATGTLMGGRFGWWLGVLGGSIVLLSTIVLIARILASAAFLAGVYGAFGKAASTFSLVSVALIIELVGILPICQVKFLMSRPGRRAYGV